MLEHESFRSACWKVQVELCREVIFSECWGGVGGALDGEEGEMEGR